jgi:hypothetical protein
MPPILLAHAEGEASLADSVAGPLRAAGYEVLYEGAVLVGESVIQEASKALGLGSPVVLCGTIAALGTGWAHQVVNAARKYPDVRVFALKMEKPAYLQQLSFDGLIAEYWQDPDKAVNDLLDSLRKYYPLKATPGGSSDENLERRYRELALRTYDIVDLANLPLMDRTIATRELLLRSLYVALRVAAEPTSGSDNPSNSLSGSASRRETSGEDEPLNVISRWPVGELLTRFQRLVVLGDPGAGKSTLLRWMATAYLLRLMADPDWQKLPDIESLPDEDWLPVLVRCRDLEEPNAAASLEQMLNHHLRKLGITGTEAGHLNELLLRRLSDGTALLLLDGLDEITQSATRARFCRLVEQIYVAYPAAPIVVTSRIVGYREIGLRIGRGFEHFTVMDLTAEDKDEFVRRWCAVTVPATRRESAKEELIRDIHSTDRIERLTGNPMLLTTMTLVKNKVGKLPSKRADLYREAVDVLLNWRSDVDEVLDPYEALPQLEYVAYAMCAAGVQQLRADEIIEVLDKMRKEFPSIRAARRRDPLEFLQLLERRTGILVEIGRVRHKGRLIPAYEFRHLTFQEYLAALALVEGRFPARNRKLSLAKNISPLAAETSTATSFADDEDDLAVSESWREVLRLCVMICNDDDVDTVLLAIADVRNDEQGSVTSRPRAVLAASCLSDEPNVSEDVATRLIDRFAEVLWERDGDFGDTTAGEALVEIGTSVWGPLLARQLVSEYLSRPDSHALRSCAATVGGQTAPRDEAGLRIWLTEQARKLGSTDRTERVYAALSVMQAGYEIATGIRSGHLVMVARLGPRLIEMLKHSGPEAESAAWAVGWLANQHNVARTIWKLSAKQQSALISCIKNPRTTASTAKSLLWALNGDYSQDRDFARAVATHLANADSHEGSSIAESYERFFRTYVDPVIPLVSHVEATVRASAAQLLGQLAGRQAVEPLITMLADPERQVRESAARALGQLAVRQAVEPLIATLADPERQVRESAAEALGQLGDRQAVEPLIATLADPERQVRESAARALGQLGDRRAVEPLSALAQRYQLVAPSVVMAALSTLGNDSALRDFQELMKDPSRNKRTTALWSLASCEPDILDQILLSRDADGIAPGIDPEQEIRMQNIERYVGATKLTRDEVHARYGRLSIKYQLRVDPFD